MRHRARPSRAPAVIAAAAAVLTVASVVGIANAEAPRVAARTIELPPRTPAVVERYEVTDLVRLPVVASPTESEPVQNVAAIATESPVLRLEPAKVTQSRTAPREAPRANERASVLEPVGASPERRASSSTPTPSTLAATIEEPEASEAPKPQVTPEESTPTETEPDVTPTPTATPTPTETQRRERWRDRDDDRDDDRDRWRDRDDERD